MMSRISKKLSIVAMVVSLSLLSACGSLMEGLTPVQSALIFDLVPIKESALKGGKVGFSLSVSEPRASAVLDSDKVLVRPSPVAIQYYGNIIWADRIPKLVHRRLVQALEDSNRLRSVAARSDGFAAQYDLLIEIRDFHIEPSTRTDASTQKPIRVKVTFYAKLVSERSAKVVRSKKISKTVEVISESPENVALAFNKAFEQASASLINWTLR